MNREALLHASRGKLITLCSAYPDAVEICGTESFVEDYNRINPPVSMVDGRNQNIIYPMHDLSYYGEIVEPPLGQGTYGVVNKIEGKRGVYAVKTFIRDEREEYKDITEEMIKEIAILRRMNHPNITKLIDIVGGDSFMDAKEEPGVVLELAMGSLHNISVQNTEIIQNYMYQLLRGLLYLHDNDIVHRDLKPANILVFDQFKRVALADFGISQAGFIPGREHKMDIVTENWRAPEIMLGTTSYGSEVDIFSLGVIFTELFIGKRIFEPHKRVSISTAGYISYETMYLLLEQIFVLGNMTDEEWPGVSKLQYYHHVKEFAKEHRKDTWKLEVQHVRDPKGPIYLSDKALDIIKSMTFPNPSKRPDARSILSSSYFDNVRKNVERDFPFKDNGPYVCGSNIDSSRLKTDAIYEDVSLLDWLLGIKQDNYLYSNVLSHARLLLDYYTSLSGLHPDRLTAATCLMISSKLYEAGGWSPLVEDFKKYGEGDYTIDELIHQERVILKTVNFDLFFPTSFEYMYHALGGEEPDAMGKSLSDLSCLIMEHIDPRLYGYSIAYIILTYSKKKLPKCFYDEFYSLEKIENQADHIIGSITRINQKYANRAKREPEIKPLLNRWKREISVKPEKDKKNYETIWAHYDLNMTGRYVMKDDVEDFIREYLQMEAYEYISKRELSPNLEVLTKYFKLKRIEDTWKISSTSLKNINVSFNLGGKMKGIQEDVLVSFENIPVKYKETFKRFIERNLSGETRKFGDIEGTMKYVWRKFLLI